MNKETYLLTGVAAIALSFALTLPAQAQANNNTNDHGLWSDVYVGGYGGYGWTDAELASDSNMSVDGGDYGLLLGYQLGDQIKNSTDIGITGAIEFHYGWSNASETETFGIGTVSVEKNNEWGISFRPGLTFISDTIPLGLKPYGIIGYRATEFEENFGGATEEHTYDGLELGIGTELVAYGDYGLRVDYTHVFYKGEGGVDPSEDDLRLGLAYHF